jgi:hypothetical protein
MREEDRLELGRCDLASFVLNQVLLAVDNVDFAVSNLANVARAEPAVEESVAGGLRVAIVAAGDNRAFAEDLAGRAGWDVVEIFIDDPARWSWTKSGGGGKVGGGTLCTMEASSREKRIMKLRDSP